MQNKNKVAVFIGRFQPPHVGHIINMCQAFEECGKLVIVLGSANSPKTVNNPFSIDERMGMLTNIFEDIYDGKVRSGQHSFGNNIIFCPVEDSLYQDHDWTTRVIDEVQKLTDLRGKDIVLYGHSKPDCAYLRDFGCWDYKELPEHSLGEKALSSTIIRNLIYAGMANVISTFNNRTPDWKNGNYVLHESTLNGIRLLRDHTSSLNDVIADYHHYLEEEKSYENFPYAKNFLTTDAVVIQSGQVLLIKRGTSPGKGLWALPGGHLNADERALDGAIRELREETGLKLQEKVLKGSLAAVENFDHPDRSLRCRVSGKKGRTLTIAHCFVLDNTVNKLPKVKGGDDASEAWWFSLAEVRSMKDQMFEDHHDIIEYFIHLV